MFSIKSTSENTKTIGNMPEKELEPQPVIYNMASDYL